MKSEDTLFHEELEPWLGTLSMFAKHGRGKWGTTTEQDALLSIFNRYVKEPHERDLTRCPNCLNRCYNVLLGEYERRPKRGFKKKLK